MDRENLTRQELFDTMSIEAQEAIKQYQANPQIPTEAEDRLLELKANCERARYEFIEEVSNLPLKDALKLWLKNLSPATARNYSYYVNDMKKKGFFPDYDADQKISTIFAFNYANHEEVIDRIKNVTDDIWKESTRQTHAACYISFTSFLERYTKGWFKKAVPNVSSQNKTFYQVHDKCVTTALTLAQWHRFIARLHDINERDSLIARCMFQGAKRISEVLNLKLEQIQWDKNIIKYQLSKTGGTLKYIPITYPQYFMDELKAYVDITSKIAKDAEKRYVFVTRTGKGVTRMRLNYSFSRAAEIANIEKVTPHMLRATWVTLVKQQGIQDTEIMKVTGHTSSKMIYAYDKTSAEENVSKKLVLI